ncbi:MAG: hypothetical protein ACRDU4_05570, partial [Mycobacterium sp.]
MASEFRRRAFGCSPQIQRIVSSWCQPCAAGQPRISSQFFHYDVTRWLDGDPAGPPPPPQRPAVTARGATSTTLTSSRCRIR